MANLDPYPIQVLSRTTNGAGDTFGLMPVTDLGVTIVAPAWVTAFTATLTTAPRSDATTPWADGGVTISQSAITGGTFAGAIRLAGAGVGVITLSGITGSSDGTPIKGYISRVIDGIPVAV